MQVCNASARTNMPGRKVSGYVEALAFVCVWVCLKGERSERNNFRIQDGKGDTEEDR